MKKVDRILQEIVYKKKEKLCKKTGVTLTEIEELKAKEPIISIKNNTFVIMVLSDNLSAKLISLTESGFFDNYSDVADTGKYGTMTFVVLCGVCSEDVRKLKEELHKKLKGG